MKGKNTFSQTEAEEILTLIEERVISNRTKQKRIRQKIRDKGFFFTDFYTRSTQYTTECFKNLIKEGKIKVIT